MGGTAVGPGLRRGEEDPVFIVFVNGGSVQAAVRGDGGLFGRIAAGVQFPGAVYGGAVRTGDRFG